MEINETIKRYIELKSMEKSIKNEINELNPIIKEHLICNKYDKLPVDGFGSFALKFVSVWIYSKAVEMAENTIEQLMAEEKATGVASFTTRTDLVFSPLKTKQE